VVKLPERRWFIDAATTDHEHDHGGFSDPLELEQLTGMSLRPKKSGWQKGEAEEMKILSPEILAGALTRTLDHSPRSDPSLQKIDCTLGWRPKSGGG